MSAHNGSVLEHLTRYTRAGGIKCVGVGWEVNEGAQDGNGDGSGDGAGTGTQARTVAEMGTGTTITGTETRIGSGRAEDKRKSARNRKIVVDAVRETGETRVEREKM